VPQPEKVSGLAKIAIMKELIPKIIFTDIALKNPLEHALGNLAR
jgi:hypothetical protein